jgi:hypothetical protein
VNVMNAARAIGVVTTSNAATGTIDEAKVLGALTGLAEREPEHRDLFDEAASRVKRSRSAGVEQLDENSVATRHSTGATIQLRYRSEIAEIFTDLAIDVGLRQSSALAGAVS